MGRDGRKKWVALLLVLACGARSQLDVGRLDAEVPDATTAARDAGEESTPYEPPSYDAWCELPPNPIDAACDAGPLAATRCGPVRGQIRLEESCALTNPGCLPVDVTGFAPFTCPYGDAGVPCANTGPGPQEVFAANRYGTGHIAAWCDETSVFDSVEYGKGLTSILPIYAYLGQSSNPRVACVGDCWASGSVTVLGGALPTKYVNAADKLAADWDVIVVGGGPQSEVWYANYGPIDIAWASTFRGFVHDYGKGVLVVADYAPTCRSPADIFAPLNAITAPAGFVFSVVDLGYSVMTIDAGCVADFP